MPLPALKPEETFIPPKDRLTERQCAAIGRVAVTWAVVELMIERLIARLSLAPSLMGYVMTDKLGPDNRISAIGSLLTVHRQKYADEFVGTDTRLAIKALLPLIKSAKGDRNYIVHSVWAAVNDNWMSRLDLSDAARSGIDFSVGEAAPPHGD